MLVTPDPYLPGHGDPRYAVVHYQLFLDYKLPTNRLSARAILTIQALEDIDWVRIDLIGLTVDRVKVDGRRPRKYAQQRRFLDVKLDRPLAAGGITYVEVAYSGKPGPVGGSHGAAGWEELTDGVLVASQPYGSPSWFPCNDRADDKSTYRLSLTTEAAYRAVANGALIAHSTARGRGTWVYDMPSPTSPYLMSVIIGRLIRTSLDDRVDVLHPASAGILARTAIAKLPEMMSVLEAWFGPYPFARFSAVVVDDQLEIPLEAQAMASFGLNHLPPKWANERLVVHELSHQWFGNAVTAKLMRDIWLHEGFACYTEWLWSQHRGLASTDERAREHYNGLRSSGQKTPLSDPGAANMFDDWVYKRGALTLHALRLAVGEGVFFAILKAWVAHHVGGVVSTADFIALVRRHTDVDVLPLFDAWLHKVALPPFPGKAKRRG